MPNQPDKTLWHVTTDKGATFFVEAFVPVRRSPSSALTQPAISVAPLTQCITSRRSSIPTTAESWTCSPHWRTHPPPGTARGHAFSLALGSASSSRPSFSPSFPLHPDNRLVLRRESLCRLQRRWEDNREGALRVSSELALQGIMAADGVGRCEISAGHRGRRARGSRRGGRARRIAAQSRDEKVSEGKTATVGGFTYVSERRVALEDLGTADHDERKLDHLWAIRIEQSVTVAGAGNMRREVVTAVSSAPAWQTGISGSSC